MGADHARDYEGSPKFVAKDKVCQALLSRLQHCSAELITRHDCNALDPLQKPHREVKPLRYRITYRVERDGLCLVEKSLRSFQEYELTSDDAREVVAATDRIVGLFMLRHDPGFRWSEVAEPEPFNVESETVRPSTGRPQSTCCIPRSRFVNANQTFELIPGYSVELFLRSRCLTRYPENRNASIKIDSLQPTPLTLLAGEDLSTRVFNLLDDPLCAWKRKFDKKHKSCDGLEGSGGCQHVEDGAVDVMVKVRNNIGPDYNYFSHRVQTSKVLFSDPQGRDFDEFANQLKAKMERARDMADQTLRSMDDFTIRIRELRGTNWSVHEPLSFRLDPSVTYCRQTIEAIIERLQSGISHVLEGHEDALATMTAHKRGHLIYDGFLDGAGAPYNAVYEKYDSPEAERKALEQKLRERICSDIIMLCKDTCALDCSDRLPNLKAKGGDHKVSIPAVRRPTSQLSVPVSVPDSIPESAAESVPASSASVRSDHTLAKKQAKHNLRAASQTSLDGADLTRVPSGVEAAKRYGYMGDIYANEENMSEPPSTPSLLDTDSISPHASALVTPQSSRNIPHDQSNHGLRIIDDGTRVIYQERSEADDIASGATDIHHFDVGEGDEIPITKGRPVEIRSEKPSRRSFDTRMPDLSSNSDPTPTESPAEKTILTPRQEEPSPAAPEVKAVAEPAVETLPEPVVENVVEPRAEPPTETVVTTPVAEKSTEPLVEQSTEPLDVKPLAQESPAALAETTLVAPEHEEKPRESKTGLSSETVVDAPETISKSPVAPFQQKHEEAAEPESKAPAESLRETPAEIITVAKRQDKKAAEPKVDELVTETLPREGVLEYVCQPASPVSSVGTPAVDVSEKKHESPVKVSQTPVVEPVTVQQVSIEPKEIPSVNEDLTKVSEIPAVKPQATQQVDDESKEVLSVNPSLETSQDDSWELVEASNALDTPPELSELPQQVEASTKSEFSFGTDATDLVNTEVLEPVKSPVDLVDDIETPKVASIAQPLSSKEVVQADDSAFKPKDNVFIGRDASEESIAVTKPVEDLKETIKDEDSARDIALEDFPKPPSVKSVTEDVHHVDTSDHTHDLPKETVKDTVRENHPEAVEEPTVRQSEDSAIDLKEQTQASVKTEEEPTQQETKPAAPGSEDSGVYMSETAPVTDDDARDVSAIVKEIPEAVKLEKTQEEQPPIDEPKETEAPIPQPIINETSIERTPVEEVSAQESFLKETPAEEPAPRDTAAEELSTEEIPAEKPLAQVTLAEVPAPLVTLAEAPSIKETLVETPLEKEIPIEEPAPLVADISSVKHEVSTKTEIPKSVPTIAVAENTPATFLELAPAQDVKVNQSKIDTVVTPDTEEAPLQAVEENKTEVPAKTEPQQDILAVKEEKPVLEPSAADEAAKSVEAPAKEISNAPLVNESRSLASPHEQLASVPIIGSIPEGDETGSYFPPSYRAQQGSVPNLTQFDMPQVIPRPRRNTLMNRPNSIALTLEIDSDPFDDGNGSPVEGRPMSAMNSPRRFFQHQRQPSAGLYGFREQRLMAIGLRNSLLPYQYRSLRREESDSRPGTSYSEQ